MKMDQSLLKLKLEVEERIKDLSGEHIEKNCIIIMILGFQTAEEQCVSPIFIFF